ncbi:MAG: preprotein translocase subunit SecE [Patescibacteria group bacterium]|jgi:preprotein translocase subunit SecE
MDISNNRITRYIKESKDELRKVIWPSRQDTVRHTLLVIGISVFVAIFLGLADWFFNKGLRYIIDR